MKMRATFEDVALKREAVGTEIAHLATVELKASPVN